MTPEGFAGPFGLEVPNGCLDAADGHPVAADRRKRTRNVACTTNACSPDHRSEKPCRHDPCGLNKLVVVKRRFGCGAFAIADRTVFVRYADDHDAPFMCR